MGLIAQSKDRRIRRAVVKAAKRHGRAQRRAGDYEGASETFAVLASSSGRDQLVTATLDRFEAELLDSNEAIGDGQILDRILTWLSEGGAEQIGNLIKLIFTLISGL